MFISTRNTQNKYSSKEAIINGLAFDGGLYIPEVILPFKDINSLKDLSYQDLAIEVISNIFNDLDKSLLKDIIYKSYSNNFDSKDITPTVKINDKYFLELHHGPTSAFKDIALQFLPRIMTSLNDDQKDIVILTATSGDTGKAALEGFSDVAGVKIKVIYPYKMVSTIQERQMITTKGLNTDVIAVKGNFDDCQRMIKEIFENNKFDNIHLTSANSINIARLIPQCTYYFKAYFDLLNNNEINFNEQIDFIVPTGNFGDILAGYLCKLMGLPINKLVIASNKNNVLTKFFNEGIYDINRTLYNTSSPSIDILVSSNLERLLYLVSKDTTLVTKLMNDLKNKGSYTVDSNFLKELQKDFVAIDASENECFETIKEYYDNYHYLIDTHTAIATAVAKKYKGLNKQVILSTASPFKFSKDVYKALTNIDINDNLEALDTLSKYTNNPIPNNLNKLKELPIRFNEVIDKQDKDIIINKLKEL